MALWEQPGFFNWRHLNETRRNLRFRRIGTQIKGISQKLEDLSPALDVHTTRYVNRLEAAEPSVENTSRSPDDSDVNAAKRVEDFNTAFFADMTRQRVGTTFSPYRRHLDDMTAYGLGFLHYTWKPGIKEDLVDVPKKDWPDPEDPDRFDKWAKIAERAVGKGFQENPFVVECPQLATVAFEPDFSMICEVGERTVGQVLKSFEGLGLDVDEEKISFKWLTSETHYEFDTVTWNTTVKYITLETSDWIYTLIDSGTARNAANMNGPFLLETVPNFAGRPMYAITPGHENNEDDVASRFQPLIAAIYPVVATMNVTRTLIQSGALNTGRPMYQKVDTTSSRGAATINDILAMPVNKRPVLMFDPSKEILDDPGAGKRWDVVPAPDMDWVLNAYQESKKDLQDWGFPTSLGPDVSTTGNAESGVQQMREMDVATDYLDPALTNVAKSLHELYLGVGDTIQGMGLPVTVHVRKKAEGGDRAVRDAVTVQPEDFKEQDLKVSLKSISAAAQAAIRESNLRLLQLELQSKETFLKNEYPDWIAEEERIELDKMKTFAREKALEALKQTIDLIAPALADQVLAEQGVPPPPVVPPDGGPAPGQTERFSRPTQPVPGVGSPNAPVDQNPQATAATAQTAVVR